MYIEYLTDRQEDIPTVIEWLYEQWGHNYEYGRKVWEERVNNRLNKKEIPTTFVAVIDDEAVGTASLIEHDMDSRKDLSPWLADVYVQPDFRGQNIATKLIKRVLEEAKAIDVPKLYLYTREATGLYKKLDWETDEVFDYHSDKVTLMSYNIK